VATLNAVEDAGAFEMYAGDNFALQFTLLDKPRANGGVPQDYSDWDFTAQWPQMRPRWRSLLTRRAPRVGS
jgi:hypothetical protein